MACYLGNGVSLTFCVFCVIQLIEDYVKGTADHSTEDQVWSGTSRYMRVWCECGGHVLVLKALVELP